MRKLEEMRQRYLSLQESMNDPAVQANSQKLVAASKEAGQLEPIVSKFEEYRASLKSIGELQEMAGNPADAEMAKLAVAELPTIQTQAAELFDLLTDEFIAAEDNAVTSFFLEIRAGTGGEEAALFARVLYEMYRKYCESKGYRFDVSDFSTCGSRAGSKK